MTLDPDNDFGFLSSEDHEKMEEVLTERSEGSYGAPALQGMLTASVVGPKPVPMDWKLQNMPLAFGQMIEFFKTDSRQSHTCPKSRGFRSRVVERAASHNRRPLFCRSAVPRRNRLRTRQ